MATPPWRRTAVALAIGLAVRPVSATVESLFLCPPVQLEPIPEATADEEQTRVWAHRLEATEGAKSNLSGEFEAIRGGIRITGERAVYDQSSDVLEVFEQVRLRSAQGVITGDKAKLLRGRDRGEIDDASFYFEEGHAFGEAGRIKLRDRDHTEFDDVSYTTCNPGVSGWRLEADHIALDDTTNTGEARHATLYFKDLPIGYLPYINFPLRGRKSGLLTPSYASSDEDGIDLSVPYYWNIAPNRDATLTPRWISQRGAMLMSEYRYLHTAGSGRLNYDYLPDDGLYGDSRSFLALNHNQSLAGGWSAGLNFQEVSDPAYFDDLSDSLAIAAQTHLPRQLSLGRWGETWLFNGLIEDFQTLTGSQPYQRLPRLQLSSHLPATPDRLHYAMDSELVHFRHSDTARPTGTRLDLAPAVDLPLAGAAWFFTPGVALRHTQYRLTNAPDEAITRTLPVTTLDTGLFFERTATLGSRAFVQTLEPRLFYLHVPYEDQDAIPVFDTTAYSLSFASLFRGNRFTGGDRVGDANQVTLALTSRLLDTDGGVERLAASIGQVRYIDDPRVTLPGQAPPSADGSDLVGELSGRPRDDLELAATVQWSADQEREEQLTTRAEYRPSADSRLYLSYRFMRDDPFLAGSADHLRQTDVALFWPLARRWQALARWNRDIEQERNLDSAFGVEYRSCCWALRLLWREAFDRTDGQADRTLYVTFALHGLGQFGQRLDEELEHGILGYPTYP